MRTSSEIPAFAGSLLQARAIGVASEAHHVKDFRLKASLFLLSAIFIFQAIAVSACFAKSTPSDAANSSIISHKLGFTLYKGIGVDRWSANQNYSRDWANSSEFTFQQDHTYILHQVPRFYRQWKQQHNASFSFSKNIYKNTTFNSAGEWDWYRDQGARPVLSSSGETNGTIERDFDVKFIPGSSNDRENEQNSSFIGIGGGYLDKNKLEFNCALGPILENKNQKEENGFRILSSFNGRSKPIGLSLTAEGWRDELPSGVDHSISATIYGDWSRRDGTQDRLSLSYNQVTRHESSFTDDYTNRRDDESFNLSNTLKTGFDTPWNLSWQSSIDRQETDQSNINSQYYQFVWKNELTVDWVGDFWGGMTYGGLDLQEQDYSGGLSKGQRTWLGIGAFLFNADGDSLGIKTYARRYRFDTPDEADKNDRDELHYQVIVDGIWQASPNYSVKLIGETDLRHLVYLYRTRSGENRWLRRFRLQAETDWTEDDFTNLARFSVVSTYTDYDYSPASEDQSRVYRVFTATDSLNINLSKAIGWNSVFIFKADDHGRLNWGEWIQALSEEGYGVTVITQPTWQWADFRGGIGWIWNIRKTWVFEADDSRMLSEDVLSRGPVGSLTFNSRNLHIEFWGRILQIKDHKRGSSSSPDVNLKFVWMR